MRRRGRRVYLCTGTKVKTVVLWDRGGTQCALYVVLRGGELNDGRGRKW